ncbi:MAG TPA: hypothetical protein PKZ41_06340 [Candidatus Omnitrophota bacterium]|nr:hypothetical protein [Candidatus Omnitrophota bacterium]
METLKNFLVGVSVLAMALVTVMVTLLVWPFLVGITSIFFFIAAVFLFLVLIFYIIVLLGHLTRMVLSAVRKDKI